MRRPAVVPVLALVVLGCGLDFSAPLSDTSARLTVHLELVDSLGMGAARMSGSLWPGFTASGNVRFLLDSSLTLLGRSIAPSTMDPPDTLRGIPYAAQWGLDPDVPPGEVELAAPDIPGIGEYPPVLRLTPPWRAGPADVTVFADSALTLGLLTGVPDGAVHESWQLNIIGAEGQYLGQMSSTGPTPATIEIPWILLAPLRSGGKIHLVIQQLNQSPSGSRYAATFLVTARHVWSVTVEP